MPGAGKSWPTQMGQYKGSGRVSKLYLTEGRIFLKQLWEHLQIFMERLQITRLQFMAWNMDAQIMQLL